MKRCWKLVPVLFLLVFGAVASGSAMARSGHGSAGHGYGYGGGVRFGIFLGSPLYGYGLGYPGYYAPAR